MQRYRIDCTLAFVCFSHLSHIYIYYLSRTLEPVQTHPQVVGVEKAVLAHVLEFGFVVLGTLRRLAQDELAIGRTHGEVARFPCWE